jgi:hypothetical protein
VRAAEERCGGERKEDQEMDGVGRGGQKSDQVWGEKESGRVERERCCRARHSWMQALM